MASKPNYNVKGNEFIIENYNNAKPFSSFFPAIAGEWGKPMWAYYVNRGQGIACFGTKDKDGAILEFQAANKAYRYTPIQAFRTFYKVNGEFYEPFKNTPENDKLGIKQEMHITSYTIKFIDKNPKLGIETTVEYFTLPNETFPALVRKLHIKNTSKKAKKIECIDGLPFIIPYGTNNFMLKNISRLAEGWYNGVFFTKKHKMPVYKLPVEPLDRPEVIKVKAGNFYVGFYELNNKINFPKFAIDSDNVFGEVKDFSFPQEFISAKTYTINPNRTGKNKTPSAMGYFTANIKSNEIFTYNSVFGNTQNAEEIDTLVGRILKKDYLEKKQKENKEIIETLNNTVLTKSSSEKFDNYCEQNFLDNLLRGGFPITIGEGETEKNYYVYSRIHGDMEREYNNFVILPEYYSQGNGNYRDVNQNRRSDVFINPKIKDYTIIQFMNLLQIDGFNPLKILGAKFKVKNAKKFLELFNAKDNTLVKSYISSPFTLGDFFNFLESKKISAKVTKEKILEMLLSNSEKIDYANAGECYWSDHWHYNIDLIENFLNVYPEELEELLFNKKEFTFFDNEHVVLPRSEKYVLFEDEPRQIDAVVIDEKKLSLINSRSEKPNAMRAKNGKGEIYTTNLIEKLLNLVVNKYASLDPECIGLEMESDRPNWCDALNGLPGSFGSSTAESLELKRLLEFLKNSLKNVSAKKIDLAQETYEFLRALEKITKTTKDQFAFWDKTHTAKEIFREKTKYGIDGAQKSISTLDVVNILGLFLKKSNQGLAKVMDKKTGVVITNIEYIPTKYSIIKEKGKMKLSHKGNPCISVKGFKKVVLPLFLEGPVHYLRINSDEKTAQKQHANIMKSPLFDKELKMLKINAPLKGVPLTIGRITIFTPGWLENESIWLHMEYKYMLELLRNNLSDEFFKFSDTALVPFMDPRVYGRSIFENSSFIVSSAHPEKDSHGQGFVSRLSGSTAEFISMWVAMTSGLKPFYLDKNNNLNLKFSPQLKGNLFTTKQDVVIIYERNAKPYEITVPKNSFTFKFLGSTVVVYHNSSRKNTYGKAGVKVSGMKLFYKDGRTFKVDGDVMSAPYALDVRNGLVKKIDVELK